MHEHPLPLKGELERDVMIPYYSKLKDPSQRLRVNMTLAEKRLWERINKRQLHGYSFCRQKPLGAFIVDFFCQKAKLVIEVDGGIHLASNVHRDDLNKETYFKSLNLNVLRFSNNEVFTDIESVVNRIKGKLP